MVPPPPQLYTAKAVFRLVKWFKIDHPARRNKRLRQDSVLGDHEIQRGSKTFTSGKEYYLAKWCYVDFGSGFQLYVCLHFLLNVVENMCENMYLICKQMKCDD